VSNLKFLKKILDSAPDSIYKIEDLTCNLDLEMPQSLGRLDDLNILCIISNINEKTTIEGKTLLKIYAHLPKNITGIAIDTIMENIAMKSKLPKKGEISELKSIIEFQLKILSKIETLILKDVSITQK
tara:strand:+ start:2164 stop:2547 length:384 start_codon:yes stop_codon:yes gene_type:complete